MDRRCASGSPKLTSVRGQLGLSTETQQTFALVLLFELLKLTSSIPILCGPFCDLLTVYLSVQTKLTHVVIKVAQVFNDIPFKCGK